MAGRSRALVTPVRSRAAAVVESRVADGGSGGLVISRKRSAVPRPNAHVLLVNEFAAQLAQYDPTGDIVAHSDNVKAMARDAAQRVIDTASTWVEHLGALYDTEGVRHLLSRDGTPISRQAVHKRHGLLALTTGSGQVTYPAFQFDGQRTVAGLAAVLDALPDDLVSRWTVASWLVSPEAELDGQRPVDVLREQGPGGGIAVLAAARRWAGQLAR